MTTKKPATKKLTIKDLRNLKAGAVPETRGAEKEAEKIPLIDTLPDSESKTTVETSSALVKASGSSRRK